MEMRVPLEYYLISGVVYTVSFFTSMLVAYFAWSALNIAKQKRLKFLFFGFVLLGFGFLTLALTSFYIYFAIDLYGTTGISFHYVNYIGFNVYYVFSLTAYVLFVLTYVPRFDKKLWVIYVPLWYASYPNFHIISILLLGFVVFRNVQNYIKKKNFDSLLVITSFVCLMIFHGMLLFTTFNQAIYLTANIMLISGFLALIYMLMRVGR